MRRADVVFLYDEQPPSVSIQKRMRLPGGDFYMTLNIREYLDDTSLGITFSGEISEHDVVVSTIVFFAAIAKADGELEPPEISALLGIIVREFNIKESEAAELMQVALLLTEDESKLEQFTGRLREKLDFLQKQLVMALVWRVMMSDSMIEKHEANLAVKLRTSLGLSMEEAVRARKLAELDTLNIAVLKSELGG